MKEIMINEKVNIEDMIYEIRGKQVMLDRELAKLYQTETRIINQAVKRNAERFPEEFCFQLTEDEFKYWRSQIVISNSDKMGLRKLPYAFTEQGVAMLSVLLKSDIAIKTSIQIMNAFVEMRKYIATNNNYAKRISNIENKIIEHDNKFNDIFDKLDNKVNNHIFFNGQIYDAYSLLLDILNKSNENIIIIDNYIDKNLLDILSKTKKQILIITDKYNNDDYDKYKKQYKNVSIKINNKFHDRFIIIDNNVLYHFGASFEDLGKKCFAINKIEDNNYLNKLLQNIK